MIETGKRVRSDGVCLAWWIEEELRGGDRKDGWEGWWMALADATAALEEEGGEKNGSPDLPAVSCLHGNWSLVWRCMRWSVWLDGERSLVAESCLVLLSAYPVQSLCQSQPPSFASFHSSSTVSLVPASLGCEVPLLFSFPCLGTISGVVKGTLFVSAFSYVRKLEGRWGNLHFLTCMLHFLSYVVESVQRIILSIGWI